MSQANISQNQDAIENALAKKNAILYAICQAMISSAAPLSIALGGIIGSNLLGVDKSLATLPVTSFNVGVALASIPAAMLMKKVGRRNGFRSGAMLGIASLLVVIQSLYIQSFWLFAIGLLGMGCSNSFAQQFRFAAADRGTKEFKAKAISIVLIGGIAAGVIGPQLILNFRDFLSPVPFAGAFLWAIGLFIIALIVMAFLEPGHPPVSDSEKAKGGGRSLFEIIKQPRFIVAALCGTITYAIMSFVMTATPLAMIGCGFDVEDATWGIQWHVLAMFGPSFFTGNLIAKFGKERIVATGLILIAIGSVIALQGIEIYHFYTSLILLGLGWNFGFIGSTAMITDTYEPHEKSKAQGANDFILFSSVALASFMSGLSLENLGWDFINWIVFPLVGIALLSLIWLSSRSKALV